MLSQISALLAFCYTYMHYIVQIDVCLWRTFFSARVSSSAASFFTLRDLRRLDGGAWPRLVWSGIEEEVDEIEEEPVAEEEQNDEDGASSISSEVSSDTVTR